MMCIHKYKICYTYYNFGNIVKHNHKFEDSQVKYAYFIKKKIIIIIIKDIFLNNQLNKTLSKQAQPSQLHYMY